MKSILDRIRVRETPEGWAVMDGNECLGLYSDINQADAKRKNLLFIERDIRGLWPEDNRPGHSLWRGRRL